VYGQTWDEPGRWYDRLVKIDTHGTDPGTNATRWGRDGWLPSEPVFVPRPGGTAEDDGVVIAVILDVTGDEPSSFLVVLDAATFTEVARATVPHVVPFGLHGEFIGAEAP
jgi:beta,beta-carotene 9',10'-dioxygenase